MLPDAHRQAAEELGAAAATIQADAQFARLAIEGCWGAVFHWIAYGTQTKHGRHQDSHARMPSFLNSLGEGAIAGDWSEMDQIRQGGMYGSHMPPSAVQRAFELLQDVRTWATS